MVTVLSTHFLFNFYYLNAIVDHTSFEHRIFLERTDGAKNLEMRDNFLEIDVNGLFKHFFSLFDEVKLRKTGDSPVMMCYHLHLKGLSLGQLNFVPRLYLELLLFYDLAVFCVQNNIHLFYIINCR